MSHLALDRLVGHPGQLGHAQLFEQAAVVVFLRRLLRRDQARVSSQLQQGFSIGSAAARPRRHLHDARHHRPRGVAVPYLVVRIVGHEEHHVEPCRGGAAVSGRPAGVRTMAPAQSWPTAAIPMANTYCSCKLTAHPWSSLSCSVLKTVLMKEATYGVSATPLYFLPREVTGANTPMTGRQAWRRGAAGSINRPKTSASALRRRPSPSPDTPAEPDGSLSAGGGG